jgi:hypothetical protein
MGALNVQVFDLDRRLSFLLQAVTDLKTGLKRGHPTRFAVLTKAGKDLRLEVGPAHGRRVFSGRAAARGRKPETEQTEEEKTGSVAHARRLSGTARGRLLLDPVLRVEQDAPP